MVGLDNMKSRIDYVGGKNQVSRMNSDKLKSLKKAMLYSYQSATAQLADGRQFKCLINPDKLKNEYDNKIISIPFEDICLNPKQTNIKKTIDGLETIGMKAGDVFTWAENNTDWLVYLQRLDETAYFRAEIRRCQYTTQIGDSIYKVYAKGPSQDTVVWNLKSNNEWNDLNYTLEMYITKNEETEEYLQRFAKLKLNGKPWEVQAVDNMSVEGVIIVALKEDFKNTIKEKIEEETNIQPQPVVNSAIIGDTIVYPYETKTYVINGAEDGTWSILSSKAKIIEQTSALVKIYIASGRSGEFELLYKRDGMDDIKASIIIESL